MNMHRRTGRKFSSVIKGMLLVSLAGFMHGIQAAPQSDSAAALQERYASLKGQLQHSPFKRQLVLDSTETEAQVKGNIYAVVDYPFAEVKTALNNPDHWCDVLLLHLNTKYCQAGKGGTGTVLNVNIGKKTAEALADSTRIEFKYQVAVLTPKYFRIKLDAKDGPMGTSDYLIVFDAVPLPNAKTFIRLAYSYSTNMAGRMAMRSYLATAGSGKVGFTVTGKQPDGKPAYIGGVRGVIERNTMRYYLAIDAFLGARNVAPGAQFEKRIQTWFDATERYARQLHEMERADYLAMKREENARQVGMR